MGHEQQGAGITGTTLGSVSHAVQGFSFSYKLNRSRIPLSRRNIVDT